jgi:hypothetical protein
MTDCKKEIDKLFSLIPGGWLKNAFYDDHDVKTKGSCLKLYIRWLQENLDIQTKNIEYLNDLIEKHSK